jgi:hypothetical protein
MDATELVWYYYDDESSRLSFTNIALLNKTEAMKYVQHLCEFSNAPSSQSFRIIIVDIQKTIWFYVKHKIQVPS